MTVPEERGTKGFKDPYGELGNVKVLGLAYDPEEGDFHFHVDRKSGGSALPDSSMVGVALAMQILKEVSVEVGRKWFHTGSITTFYLLQNRTEKYPVLVVNCINRILLSFQAREWRWVLTDKNNGPSFIKEEEDEWHSIPAGSAMVGAAVLQADRLVAEADPSEARPQKVATNQVFGDLTEHLSSVDKRYRVVAYVICFTRMVQARGSVGKDSTQDTVSLRKFSSPSPSPSLTELVTVENYLIKDVQHHHFGNHIRRLQGGD